MKNISREDFKEKEVDNNLYVTFGTDKDRKIYNNNLNINKIVISIEYLDKDNIISLLKAYNYNKSNISSNDLKLRHTHLKKLKENIKLSIIKLYEKIRSMKRKNYETKIIWNTNFLIDATMTGGANTNNCESNILNNIDTNINNIDNIDDDWNTFDRSPIQTHLFLVYYKITIYLMNNI